MDWLCSDKSGWRAECTGFAFNMVTGTYEFPCLIAIDDEHWWAEYGHQVEANWEAMRSLCYSSRDTAGFTELIANNPQWSNEGLFAFLEGLRRLSQHSMKSIFPPTVERAI
jgi:hypothetical protein